MSIINPPTDVFNNITDFEVFDRSSPRRGLCGLFLGLLKNLKNIKKLILKTQDFEINGILEQCLPKMTKLEEIHLTSIASKVTERLMIIKKFVPQLKKLSVASKFVEDARKCFLENVEIYEI